MVEWSVSDKLNVVALIAALIEEQRTAHFLGKCVAPEPMHDLGWATSAKISELKLTYPHLLLLCFQLLSSSATQNMMTSGQYASHLIILVRGLEIFGWVAGDAVYRNYLGHRVIELTALAQEVELLEQVGKVQIVLAKLLLDLLDEVLVQVEALLELIHLQDDVLKRHYLHFLATVMGFLHNNSIVGHNRLLLLSHGLFPLRGC